MRGAGARALSLALSSLALAASCGRCGGGAGAGGAASVDQPPAGEPPPAKPAVGKVVGRVLLAPGATLPAYSPKEMEKQVLTQADTARAPDVCSPPKQNDRTPVELGDDNALIGVVVAASDFRKAPSVRPPTTIDVTIDDCRLTPRTVLGQVGDRLRVRNKVDYAFMPAFGAVDTVKTLLPGQTYDVTLEKPGVATLACGFTAPCGRTDVITLQHSFATLTDAHGQFSFDAFPADEPITLSAWHPLFQEATVKVVVGGGEQKSVDLVVTPIPGAAAAPTAPSSPGAAASPSTPATPSSPGTPSSAGKSRH